MTKTPDSYVKSVGYGRCKKADTVDIFTVGMLRGHGKGRELVEVPVRYFMEAKKRA